MPPIRFVLERSLHLVSPNALLLVLGLAVLAPSTARAAEPKSGSDCCGYSVAGTVWYDQNSNGVQDLGEPPLAGWTVNVFNVSNVLVGTTVTNGSGQYSFAVPVGCGQTFKIKQVVQGGWGQTFPPANGFHTGSGTGCIGTVYGPYDFGNNNTGCTGLTKVYTLDADFNLGTLSGVITNSDQLELSPTPTTWPYAWIANSGEGTISKVDTQTGNEVGRYYTGPPQAPNGYGYLAPSRTVIDKDGNCWVANRTAPPYKPSVTQILITGGDDRNLNSNIETSADVSLNGQIDPGEILPWGQDERVKRHYLLGSITGNPARGMVIDKMGFLWVGLSTSLELVKVDPNLPIATYAPNLPQTTAPSLVTLYTGQLPYGLALAPSGLIYMSTHSNWAFEIDPGIASGGTGAGPAMTDSINHAPFGNYGIAVDKDCNVWLASPSHPLCIRWNTVANTWSVSGAGAPAIGRGITVDFNNNVWMACNDWGVNSVTKYANTPSPAVIGVYPTPVPVPVGVGIGSDGNVIVTPNAGSNWSKVNSSTGAVMSLPGPQLVGYGPYTYSDFTGSLQTLTALQQGTWNVITDGLSPNIVWTLISWTPSTPPGTSITIDARVAQTLPALAVGSWVTIGSPGPLGTPMPGRYIETRARLQRANEGCSPPFVTPILYDLTVQAICDSCEFVNCPSDTTVPCQMASGAIFEYSSPLLESICDGYTFSCSPPSGSVFPIGTTPVVCTAVSGSGDTVKCVFNVTVLPGCNPTPTGACCLSNNCTVTTEQNCTQQGGIYFGDGSNCTVGCKYDCVPPPHHMVGWWKLDGAFGDLTPNLANPAVGGKLIGNPTPAPGEVGGAYSFNGQSQYVDVANNPSLSLGTGDFSIDAWVKTSAVAGIRPIVDKRGGAVTKGFGLFLNNGYPSLQLNAGSAPANFSLSDLNGGTAAFAADNQWHLVAVTVDRDRPDGVRFYVDGHPVGTPFDPTSQSGSLDNPASLLIGKSHPLPTPRFWQGPIDEVEIIHANVGAEKIAAIHLAGPAGKCPELCYASQAVPCCAGLTSTSSVTICNYDNVSHVYSYGLSPLTGGPPCGPVGPTSFTPASGTVTVGPGSCVTVPITIGCPSNIPIGQLACYQVSIFNHDTGRLFACKGSVRITHKWCLKWSSGPVDPIGIVTLNEAQTTTFNLQAGNIARDESAPSTLSYEIRPLAGGCCETDAPSTAVRLNGLPPGEPVFGTLSVAPRSTGNVSLDVEYPTAWLIGYERLAVYGDDDGDGVSEELSEIAVRGIPSSLVGVPGEPPVVGDGGGESARLFVGVPNPFGATGSIRFRLPGSEPAEVKLRLFDLSGRSVKIFYMERLLEPGEHSVAWSTIDDRGVRLGTGMYFLKLEVGKRTETVKVVVRR